MRIYSTFVLVYIDSFYTWYYQDKHYIYIEHTPTHTHMGMILCLFMTQYWETFSQERDIIMRLFFNQSIIPKTDKLKTHVKVSKKICSEKRKIFLLQFQVDTVWKNGSRTHGEDRDKRLIKIHGHSFTSYVIIYLSAIDIL